MPAVDSTTSTSTPTGSDHRVAKFFQAIALVEALTWCGLLVGMAFKYVVADTEVGVQIFGPLHGVAFMAYVAATLVAARTFGWSLKLTAGALACSIPPLATWPFEIWVTRTGRLSQLSRRDG